MTLPARPTRALAALGALALAAAVTAAPALAAPAATATAPAAPGGQALPDGPVGGPLLGTRNVVVPAGAPALPKGVDATGWVVADAGTGAVLAARDPHGKYLPASTLKTLTALTLLPRLTDRKRVVTATAQDVNIDGTRVGLVEKGRYSVEMLFQCMLMMSGNDCATALAEAGGGVPQTLKLMNQQARDLQALDTHAATPSGLDGPHQASSAYDLALILRADLKLPDFRRYNMTRQGTVPAQPPKYPSFKFDNDNRLTPNYAGVVAAKNGYTDAARHTFVAAAKHGSRTLIVTLMHGERSPVDMWQQAASLLDWGFRLPASFAPVGTLVEPVDPNAVQKASSTRVPAPGKVDAAGRSDSTHRGSSALLPALIAAVGAVAVLGTGAVGWRRARRRGTHSS